MNSQDSKSCRFGHRKFAESHILRLEEEHFPRMKLRGPIKTWPQANRPGMRLRPLDQEDKRHRTKGRTNRRTDGPLTFDPNIILGTAATPRRLPLSLPCSAPSVAHPSFFHPSQLRDATRRRSTLMRLISRLARLKKERESGRDEEETAPATAAPSLGSPAPATAECRERERERRPLLELRAQLPLDLAS